MTARPPDTARTGRPGRGQAISGAAMVTAGGLVEFLTWNYAGSVLRTTIFDVGKGLLIAGAILLARGIRVGYRARRARQ
jgi:hypothetical protein